MAGQPCRGATKGEGTLFDLTGKTAVVTGGGGVLGGAIAMGLAQAGARVAIADVLVDKGWDEFTGANDPGIAAAIAQLRRGK